MEVRYESSRRETAGMNTEELRQNFLVPALMQPGSVKLVYSHYDRMIVGGAVPTKAALTLDTHSELKSGYFLERRELGVINVGGNGIVVADGTEYPLEKLDGLYIGKGVQDVHFRSTDAAQPAQFYLLSAPAHATYPTNRCTRTEAAPVTLGDASTSNRRTIFKYIHADGLQSCQLVMGLTL
ncbi:MAG: 5-dehydro-4-deoxy-D-glucuronate isomerase, partial [Chitinophagaceae bacterium]